MFEDSTFESQGTIHTHSRNWMLATLLFNGSILLTLILIPLLHPDSLPNQWRSIHIVTPAAPEEASPLPATHTSSQSVTMPSPILMPVNTTPQLIRINPGPSGPVPDTPGNCCTDSTGSGSGIPGGDPFSHAVAPSVRVISPHGPVTISKGVAAGMAISQPPPAYPAIARAAGIQGTVILQATISKSGTIEGLRVVGGPAMLRQSALDAVKQWRYRPYLLNGDPVEVETTINVIFSLGR